MDNTFGINIIPENDEERIAALNRYKILDTPPEGAFDNVARLATQIFKVPISLISLVDAENVYFKANIGMSNTRVTSRGVSLCSLAVLKPEVTVFENAFTEPCLLTNPNVAGQFGLKFYAGAPITTHDGFLIGTLCIIDKSPREFDSHQREILQSLAEIVMDEIELRLSAIEEIEKQQAYIEEAAATYEELLTSNEELELSQQQVSALNEELAATNQEIANANKELLVTNNELTETQERLLLLNTQLADSQELKNIAIEQAKLGIWYIDAVTRQFMPSCRLKEFFGYNTDEVMPYDATVEQIRDDYRNKVVNEVNAAIKQGKTYDLEYPIIQFRTQQLRWVRATGKLNPALNGRDSYFSGTVMDITEQKKDDQRKNDFIGMVSHELKTPLTSLSAYIQMLLGKAQHNKDSFTVGALEKARRQVQKMTTMINGFLNVSRLESGKIHIDRQHFNMKDLVKDAEDEAIATNMTHHIVFKPVEPTFVKADHNKIGHVINNFISNAVKYSPVGSTINVACVTVNGSAQVSVTDQGIGIKPDDMARLFERYYRVENNSTQSISGFGIGLYLCAEIIERHNGSIWVESEWGIGSTFYFSIPLAAN
ncbi:ATP-binding protein [Mucilaginibacter terrae]|uniref:ATP-binding protein n=1 Tax=Mucilaginibacter terrae TaxID=1955052 RepID=UPI00362FB717